MGGSERAWLAQAEFEEMWISQAKRLEEVQSKGLQFRSKVPNQW
jgi:hypothetical protein